MTKTYKFVYAMILFLYIFQIARNVDANFECKSTNDCPKSVLRVWRCINNYCRPVRMKKIHNTM
ncbi:putative Late nodulin [Medicago truncatula]|uniref:Nodule Cysteine-Rich (NCR) secreted peptide n=1 Tax=Medicago truncatula TaxID=3880 RepID=A0A072UQA7_MEDTR|nr:Nodule Cysteine-Rich (NCR) secreted peptide [Medicago truncatula]RHN55989.1 putative Late nodulin [Medicago truncatula]